jgi:hypothetical protein
MGLLGFISRESAAQRGRVLAAAAASGLANALFIAIINAGAAYSANDEFKLELAAAALFAVALYALLQHYALSQAVQAAETALSNTAHAASMPFTVVLRSAILPIFNR